MRAGEELTRSQEAVFDELDVQFREGEYEKVEAGARAMAAAPRSHRSRGPAVDRLAGTMAVTTAIAHGHGGEVLAEVEAQIVDLERTVGAWRMLLVMARANRTAILVGQKRYAEAEAEAGVVLRESGRLARLDGREKAELSALAGLAKALCGQGRYEEAHAIAAGNLPRAQGRTAFALRSALVHSLSGLGRHEEALAEAGRFPSDGSRAESGSPEIATATALYGLGRRSEAEAMARQALALCEQRLHPDHPRTEEARALLRRITAGDPPA
ncbi:tetratricopeptide repeat protein [Streptomyces sp. NPDC050738]|uniref:tetratricopeptide repeat protein n=1 Tax=Streptomyces sp. NPDC050738 TaxID=3154744 RepID=UPI00342826A6